MLFLGGIMILKNNIKHNKLHNIFDIDGTLTYFNGLNYLVDEALSDYGYEVNDKYHALQYKAVQIIMRKAMKYDNFFNLENYIKIHKRTMGLYESNAHLVVMRMLELTPKYTSMYPNVRETLEQLNQSAICSTNWFREIQREKLKSVGIERYFSSIYTCEDLSAKPNKKHFKHIIKKEKYNPNECVMIGDSLCDLGASHAGIDTILVDYELKKENLYDRADAVITDFGDLKKILRR